MKKTMVKLVPHNEHDGANDSWEGTCSNFHAKNMFIALSFLPIKIGQDMEHDSESTKLWKTIEQNFTIGWRLLIKHPALMTWFQNVKQSKKEQERAICYRTFTASYRKGGLSSGHSI